MSEQEQIEELETTAEEAIPEEQEELEAVVESAGDEEQPVAAAEDEPEDREKHGLTAALLEERRKRQEAYDLLEKIRAQETEKERTRQQQPVDIGPEPREEDFEDWRSYQKAIREYDRKAAVAEIKAEQQREREESEQRTIAEERQKEVQEFIRRAESTTDGPPDFQQVLVEALSARDLPMTELMGQAIRTDEQGPKIAYYLQKNLAEMRRIASLPPLRQVAAIGALSERVKSSFSVSKAPDPVKRVKTANGGATKTLDKMTTAERIAYWNKQEAARRGR